MEKVINLYKPEGYTPLEVVEAFRVQNAEYKDATLGYAGRLDPMASGVLVVLVNDENLKRKEYERLPKTYDFEILFGVSTDTYDVMGSILKSPGCIEVDQEKLSNVLLSFLGAWEQKYPMYSSARVNGKPLFWWARNGGLSPDLIPSKKVKVLSIELLSTRKVVLKDIAKDITSRIEIVKGDFRQSEITCEWGNIDSNLPLCIAKAKVSCSSGLYVRAVADSVGVKIGTPTLAYSITRTSVGEYNLSSSITVGSIR